MIDNNWVSKSGLVDTDQPIKEFHDVDVTHANIQRMLTSGIPNWYKWPNDYKQYVKESFAAERARSNDAVAGYRWDDQDILSNKEARHVNKLSSRDFLEKLQKAGIKCIVMDNGFQQGSSMTVGLWAVPPHRQDKLRYVCYLDVPFMWEWSIQAKDEHGLPAGEDTRGWRTVLIQLVEKEIMTEGQIGAIFGVPDPNPRSKRYFRSLWEFRNKRKFVETQDESVKMQ